MKEPIKIIEVNIKNFRSFKKVNIKLGNRIVLIGSNNSGKTNFLLAMRFGLGETTFRLSKDDVFVNEGEIIPPTDREIIVDVLIKPWNYQINSQRSTFNDENDEIGFWLNLWARGIIHGIEGNDENKEYIVIRSKFFYDNRLQDYNIERYFLDSWSSDPDLLNDNNIREKISIKELKPILFQYIDENRDITDDMKNRNSYLNKLISSIEISEAEKLDLENKLNEINNILINKSSTFTELNNFIKTIGPMISNSNINVEISTVPRSLREITKGFDITINEGTSDFFSITEMGRGTKSIASILSFYAFFKEQIRKFDFETFHFFLGIEEPENHLHPQSQKKLLNFLFNDIQGQVVLSTHSPFVAELFDMEDIRYVNKLNTISTILPITLNIDPIEKLRIQNWILKSRGYLLFAKALILVSGATELNALPHFIKEYWGNEWLNLEIEIINVSGDGNYLPFIKFATSINMKTYILSDGEDSAIEKINSDMNELGFPEIDKNDTIFIMPEKKDFEKYFIDLYLEDLVDMFVKIKCQGNENYKSSLISTWNGYSEDQKKNKLNNIFDDAKPYWGNNIGEYISKLSDKTKRIPNLFLKLFEKLNADFG